MTVQTLGDRLVTIRAHLYLLEQEVRVRLREANEVSGAFAGCQAAAYASVLDLIHSSMRECGLEYET
jgi:hypothetical protein